jgi:hypothetical protein
MSFCITEFCAGIEKLTLCSARKDAQSKSIEIICQWRSQRPGAFFLTTRSLANATICDFHLLTKVPAPMN